jgi:hypothetical protein
VRHSYNDIASATTATTTAATLTVDAAPVVGVNPTSTTINSGGNTSFISSATGNPVPTEQWQVSTDGGDTFSNITDGGVYSGTASATLSITGATTDMNGYEYRNLFTNGSNTATTTPSTLTVDFAPTITTNPTSSTINTGSSTTFTVAAAGNPTPSVQWQVSTDGGNNFNNLTDGGIYSGSATSTLTVTEATLTENGYEYRAIFSNTLFDAGEPTTATTAAATLTVTAAPVVGVNPTSATINAGGNTSFISSATGNPTPTEQWQVSTNGGATFSNITNGGVYSGATSPTMAITGATPAMNSYEYRDVFTNGNSTATTTPSTLTVDFAPTVTTNPTSGTVNPGSTTTFTVAATGNPALSVQWQVSTDNGTTFSNLANAGIYSGVATDTLTVTGTSLAQNGYQYRAVFRNTLLGAESPSTAATTTATLHVGVPVITVSAHAQLISSTSNTGVLNVQAQQDGTDANLIYTWSILSQPATVASRRTGGVGSPPPLALFALNGTNAAKNTPVTFLASGQYTLQVAASNGTQSATSQVQLTVHVKSSVRRATTEVSRVQALGSAQSITGFAVTFNGPLDPTSAQDIGAYQILLPGSLGGRQNLWQELTGHLRGTQGGRYASYQIASAVYHPQTDSVTLTLVSTVPVVNGVGLLIVKGTGPDAVVDANGKPLDGRGTGKPGSDFTYRFRLSAAMNAT